METAAGQHRQDGDDDEDHEDEPDGLFDARGDRQSCNCFEAVEDEPDDKSEADDPRLVPRER